MMRRPWMVIFAITMHLWWGGIFLSSLGGYDSSVEFRWFRQNAGADLQWFFLNGGQTMWGAIFLVVALMALVSIFIRNQWISIWLILPQQTVMMIGAIGYLTTWTPAAAISFPALVFAAILHTVAMIDHYGRNIWKRGLSL